MILFESNNEQTHEQTHFDINLLQILCINDQNLLAWVSIVTI